MQAISWKSRAVRWFMLIGVPALMLLLAGWQYGRSQDDQAVFARITEMQQMLQHMDAQQLAHPGERLSFTDARGRSHDLQEMRERLQATLDRFHADGLQGSTRKLEPALAGISMTTSLLALVVAVLGMAYLHLLGRQAMRSRELLLSSFLSGRQWLPVFMVVMVLLLFGTAIALMAFELLPMLRQPRLSGGDLKLMLVIGVAALALLVYGYRILRDVLNARRRAEEDAALQLMGHSVTREQAPALWALVETLAERAGARPPEHLVAGLSEGFFVTEQALQLVNGSQVPRGRVLYLSLPYMAFLNAQELSAVVGHELAHFAGEDSLYSQRFAPIYSASLAQIAAVGGMVGDDGGWRGLLTRPATVFGEMFLDSFHAAVRHWSRLRELAADAVGAQVAGADAVASSLLRTAALEPHMEAVLQEHWMEGGAQAEGLLARLRQRVAREGLADPRGQLHQRQTHPFDTHPEIADRLAALKQELSPQLLARAMDAAPSRLLQDLGLEAVPDSAGAASDVAAPGIAIPQVSADIHALLQGELSDVAAQQRQARIEALQQIAAEAGAPVDVRESAGLLLFLAWLFALPAMGVGLWLVLRNPGGMGYISLALGVLALVGAYRVRRRTRSAGVVICADGLQLYGSAQLLPWSAVEDFHFSEMNGSLQVQLALAKDAAAPRLQVSRLRASYFKRKHALRLGFMGLAGAEANAVCQTMVNYWRAYHARVELKGMGVAG